MKIPTRKEFIDYVKDHLNNTGEKHYSFGKRVLGDNAMLYRLFNENKDIRLSTMLKINEVIEKEKRELKEDVNSIGSRD